MLISVESTEWLFSPLFPGRIEIWKMLVFVEGGKPEYPRKTPHTPSQTQRTCDAETRNRTRATLVRGSHHCAIPAHCL